MRLLNRSIQISTTTASGTQKADVSKEKCGLELTPTEQSDRFISDRVHSILAQIGNLCKTTIAILTKEPEIEIWQKQDRYGHMHWHVYDPQMSKSISFTSELEMLSWLDNKNGRF
jgi:hypothetical protein